jgi:hypothetical protein
MKHDKLTCESAAVIQKTEIQSPETTLQQATTASSASTTGFLRFRTFDIAFSYPNKTGAVWVDQGQTTDHGPTESYIYRYPYDPEIDADVNSKGEYVYIKNAAGAKNFSLKIYSDYANESIEQYITRTYPDLDLSKANSFERNGFTGFVLSYPGSLGSGGGQVLMVKSGHGVFELTNESQMFTDREFAQIIDSVGTTTSEKP